MKLLVGLGNPGVKYDKTRHNAGFLVLDAIAKDLFDQEISQEKFQALLARVRFHSHDCWLLKPMTFMNLSGRSVVAAQRFFKIASEDTIVLHDDLDLPFGRVKARVGGGHGGHNGIRSIIAETGSAEFKRLKIGIGRPSREHESAVVNYVLGAFSESEVETLQGEVKQECLVRLEGLLNN